jgi:hypothetical protein
VDQVLECLLVKCKGSPEFKPSIAKKEKKKQTVKMVTGLSPFKFLIEI